MKVNTMLFDALGDVFGPIATAKISMFSSSDRYVYPPFLRLRFKNVEKNDIVYLQIKKELSEFEGNVKWDLITNENSNNYLIIPEPFIRYNSQGLLQNKDFFINEFTENGYKQKIDLAIIDIPNLTKKIYSLKKS